MSHRGRPVHGNATFTGTRAANFDLVPGVSVGLPVRDGEAFLTQTLEFLLAQDHDDLEVVISDNASTDATEDICRGTARLDSRVAPPH